MQEIRSPPPVDDSDCDFNSDTWIDYIEGMRLQLENKCKLTQIFFALDGVKFTLPFCKVKLVELPSKVILSNTSTLLILSNPLPIYAMLLFSPQYLLCWYWI